MSQAMSQPEMSQADAARAAMKPLEGLAASFEAAAEQTRNLVDSSVRTWMDEGRAFIDDMARDGATALKELQGCKSPLDVITVEQKWLMARTQAYIEASMRMMTTGLLQAEQVAATAGAGLHLPE